MLDSKLVETSLARTREIFNSQELAQCNNDRILLWISLHRGIDLKRTGVTRSARHLRDIIACEFNEGFDKTMIQDCPGCINKAWYRAISTAKSFWFPLYGCLQCLTRVCFVSIGRHLPLLQGRILLQALQSAQRHLADPGEVFEMQAFAYQRTAIYASCYRCAHPDHHAAEPTCAATTQRRRSSGRPACAARPRPQRR